MIDSAMDSSSARDCTASNISSVENFKHGGENDMVVNTTRFLLEESLEVTFLGQPRTLEQETRPLDNPPGGICFK